MGWVSQRHMKSGGSIGPGGLGEAKKGAPLRKVVQVLVPQASIFSQAEVVFECGHTGRCWGGVRGRCIECRPTPACRCAGPDYDPDAPCPVAGHGKGGPIK